MRDRLGSFGDGVRASMARAQLYPLFTVHALARLMPFYRTGELSLMSTSPGTEVAHAKCNRQQLLLQSLPIAFRERPGLRLSHVRIAASVKNKSCTRPWRLKWRHVWYQSWSMSRCDMLRSACTIAVGVNLCGKTARLRDDGCTSFTSCIPHLTRIAEILTLPEICSVLISERSFILS